jgi:acyl-CoA reductase-like NAD-dependent aldehyde dehydrogenase
MSEARNAGVLERGLLIGGKSVPASSGRLADDVCPWDGEIYARVAAGTPADITRAADAAQAAFPSWSAMGAFERREIFLRAAEVMARRGEEAITALARETGASRLFSQFNLAFCIQVLREAAAAITRPAGELLATSIPGAYSIAQRIPVGVVGAISPWNAPLVLGIRSIAIPLAVGNTVVMKPSEDAPVTCGLLLADVLTEAGLPAGVLNVVTNDLADAGDVVAALIADPRVRMVNFTGSTGVGRLIGVQAAQHLKPAVLELGGKNPLIILEDADPDLAVDAAVFGAFMNSGQLCMSTDRIIIHHSLAEAFIPRYAERVSALPAGDPADPATIIGPLINTPRRAAGLPARPRRRRQGRHPAHRRRNDPGAEPDPHPAGRAHRREARHGHLRRRDLRAGHRHPPRRLDPGRHRPGQRHPVRADRRGHLPKPHRSPGGRRTRPVRDHPHQRPGHRR